MKVCLVTTDVGFLDEVRDCFEASGVACVGVVVLPGEPLPGAAVHLYDGLECAVQAGGAVGEGPVRWLVVGRRGASGPDPDPATWDATVHWPPSPERLNALVADLRASIRARAGIASSAFLAAGMKQLMALASESIEITDQTVRLLYVNPAFEEITGWQLDEVVGRSTGELFRAGTHDPAYYADIMATLRRGEVWRGPLIGRRRNDELSFQEATLAPVAGPDGSPLGFVAIKRDLARDALAERAFENRERRLQTMLEGAGDGVFVHDAAGVLADANPSACALVGLDRAALVAGRRLGEFFVGVSEAELVARFEAIEVGAPITVEGAFRHVDGHVTPVSLRLGAFHFGGERFVLTLARDVSERVDLERRLRLRTEELAASLEELRTTQRELVQREKLAALSTLVAGVAHEVNTPLGVALTALSHADSVLAAVHEAMISPSPSRKLILARMDELAQAMTLALTNGQRAATLVSDFKKVAVDQASEAERDVVLDSYLDSVVSALSPMLRKAGARVHLDAAPIALRTRPGAIAQVVTNLIQNAVHHAFQETERAREIWVRASAEGGTAVVEVEDRGVGIPAELLPRVFDPFVSTRLGSGGSGLGMHVVHNLVVEVLQGSVEIVSTPGRGTCVKIRLPLTPTPTRAPS